MSVSLRIAGPASFLVAWLCAPGASAAVPAADPAPALQARYAALRDKLDHSPFPQHLYVESFEGPNESRGDVYSVAEYPITAVSDAFRTPAHWCDVLILHLNVKYCHSVAREGQDVLLVAIGRKHDQPLDSASRVEFVYGAEASRPDYVDVTLNARSGPLGTGNYRISLEAVGLDPGHSFVHLRYSYEYDSAARAAMQLYLATAGSGKVGFTVIGDPHAAHPQFISGVRGAIERNTMRYYLAIDAYLGTRSGSVPDRFEKSIERWFDSTERYPRQLHEVDRRTYLEMKRREYLRQQAIL